MFDYKTLKKIFEKKGYPWYSKAYDLNLIGYRNKNRTAGPVDDLFMIAYKDGKGVERVASWPITTDPTPHYLKKPINKKGTAILAPGHYPKMWQPGLHRGKYRALVQRGPCTVIRDDNRDNILDFDAAKRERGYFGINLHHGKGPAASAGCQVVPEPAQLKQILELVDKQGAWLGTKRVSYTLLFEPEVKALIPPKKAPAPSKQKKKAK